MRVLLGGYANFDRFEKSLLQIEYGYYKTVDDTTITPCPTILEESQFTQI